MCGRNCVSVWTKVCLHVDEDIFWQAKIWIIGYCSHKNSSLIHIFVCMKTNTPCPHGNIYICAWKNIFYCTEIRIKKSWVINSGWVSKTVALTIEVNAIQHCHTVELMHISMWCLLRSKHFKKGQFSSVASKAHSDIWPI